MGTELTVGSVVRLKSGGPKMTITKVDAVHAEAECMWFHSTGALKDAPGGDPTLWAMPAKLSFPIGSLESING